MPSKYVLPIALCGLGLIIVLAIDLYRQSKYVVYNPNLSQTGVLYVPRYHGSD